MAREQIVRAALELLDDEGLDRFSTRRLATRLGIRSPSLYWHVANQDELFALVIDDVVGGVELPSRALGWNRQLRSLGQGLRRALIAHPAAAQLLVGRLAFGPNGLRLADRIVGVLRRDGFSDRLAAYGYTVLINYVVGSASQETAFGKGPRGQQRLADVRRFLGDLSAEEYPDLSAVGGPLTSGRFTERFDLGLTGILESLATRLDDGGRG